MGVTVHVLAAARCGVLLFLQIRLHTAVPIDNGVVGFPAVTCGPHSIQVNLDTEKPFGGRLFVKGESEVTGCNTGFTGNVAVYQAPFGAQVAYLPQAPNAAVPVPAGPVPGAPIVVPAPIGPRQVVFGTTTVGFELALGQCNMRRQRTLYPRGVEYTYTLVVSFHPLFITKVDKAYRVRCFYMEAEKTVNSQIDVSMLTTMQLNEQFPMPQCQYHIKRDSPDGAFVRYAKVGDQVFHVWECDHVAGYVFGMLVKNCYVDDGRGNKFQLLDDKGCAVDIHLVPNLTYDDKLIRAWVESHVFKYADNPQLYFTCTVQLCFKADGGCNGVTPPACGTLPLPAPYVPVNAVLPAPGAVVPPLPTYVQPQSSVRPTPVEPIPYGNLPNGYFGQVPAPIDTLPIGAVPLPFNRDAPIREQVLEATASETKNTTINFNTDSEPAKDKREIKDSARTKSLIEADITAQPLVVLPFDDLQTSDKETDAELFTLNSRANNITQRSVVHLFNRRLAGVDNDDGVCLSTSGFGMLLALLVALFLFSAVVTALLFRGHLREKLQLKV